ncbi:MAG TPA: ROK family protein [Candidatus Acidoferrales bacterium]
MTWDSYSIGVDLGGTNLRIAAYTPGAGILETKQMPTRVQAGRDAVVSDMCSGVRELRDKYSANAELRGVAIGSPGPLELPEGRMRNPPNFPGFDGLELRAAVQSGLGLPVVVENDANLAAYAECMVGKGKKLGVNSLVMLTLGTGVGSGIILNGKIWDGMNGMAGEIGHNTIFPDGDLCLCGNHGCLEVLASATAVRKRAVKMIASGNAPGLTALEKRNPDFMPREIAELAAAGDVDARNIFVGVGQALGIALAAAVNTLNLPLYVVGGGLINSWPLFAPTLFEELRHRSYVYRLTDPERSVQDGGSPSKTQVLPAELGSDAGLLGACLLAFGSSE